MPCRNLKPTENLLICPPYDFSSDDCPPPIRRPEGFEPPEPKKLDPRPPLPCTNSGCCACRPGPLRKKPIVPNLKLRQLADCYSCRVSEGCHNRKKVFYQRWQTHLDRLPRRYPNTDYSTYCCDNYVDLGVNTDFLKYDTSLALRDGPRKEALKNFLWMKNLAQVNYDMKCPMYECPPHEPYLLYQPPMMKDSPGKAYDKRHGLYHEDGITRWRELVSRPEYDRFVEGTTPFNCPTKPFRKDTSFTNPVTAFTGFSSGNNPPFKEFRALKMM